MTEQGGGASQGRPATCSKEVLHFALWLPLGSLDSSGVCLPHLWGSVWIGWTQHPEDGSAWLKTEATSLSKISRVFVTFLRPWVQLLLLALE